MDTEPAELTSRIIRVEERLNQLTSRIIRVEERLDQFIISFEKLEKKIEKISQLIIKQSTNSGSNCVPKVDTPKYSYQDSAPAADLDDIQFCN